MEITNFKNQTKFGTIYQIGYSTVACTISGLAYLFRENVSNLVLVMAVLHVLHYFLRIKFLGESISFYHAAGQFGKLSELLGKVCDTNKVGLSDKNEIIKIENLKRIQNEESFFADKESETGNISLSKILLENKKILKTTVIMCIIWSVLNINYYGLVLSTGMLSTSLFLTCAVSGLAECVGVSTYKLLCDHPKLGRKYSSVFYFGLCWVFCWLTGFLQIFGENAIPKFIIGICFCIARLSTAAFYAVIMQWTNEIFPTVIKNQTMGLCNFMGYLSSTICPIILATARVFPTLPIFVFGGFALISMILCLFPPETLGKEPIHLIEQAKRLYK